MVLALVPWPERAWVLGVLVIAISPAIGTLWAPAMSQLSDGAERLALEQGFAFALVNIAWSVGDSVGAAGGGKLGQSAGDEVPYLILAALCAVTLAGVVAARPTQAPARPRRGGGYAAALMTAELIDGKAIAQDGARRGRARRAGVDRRRAPRARAGDRAGGRGPRVGHLRRQQAEGVRGGRASPASTTGCGQDAEHAEVEAVLRELNDDARVSGILLQLPTPPQVDGGALTELIAPYKDVDGLTPVSAGLLAKGRPGLRPCTPAGVMELLRRHDVVLEGAEAVVVGRSDLVGKPVGALLLAAHATVTICHSRTRDLAEVCRRADVLVAAVGVPELVRGDWVKEGAVVIDVGINRTDAGLRGDVEFDGARASARG